MTPLIVLEVVNNALKLALILAEGKDPAVARAESLILFRISYRLLKPFLGEDLKNEVEDLLKQPRS